MTKTSVKGTVKTNTVMVPIIWDSPGFNIRVPDTSVETALKSFTWGADVLGFQFSQVVRGKVATEDGQEFKFSRRRENPEKYLFATKVLDEAEVAALRAGQSPLSEDFNRIQARFRDQPANVFYDSDIGLQYIKPENREYTILINKKGEQLFPRKPG